MTDYWNEIDKKKEQLRRLKKRLPKYCMRPIGDYKLEDVLHAIRRAGLGEDFGRECFFVVFDSHANDRDTTYKEFKCIYPIVWYFHLTINDQPAPTINFLYQQFFAEELLLTVPKNNLIKWEK